jgi:ParB/RepB/Spo0J family partition protein
LGLGGGILLGANTEKMNPLSVKTEQIREWSNTYRLIHPDAVRGMVASMQSTGQLQPIILQLHDDRYNIIDGIKRYRAAQELGMEELQSLVFEVNTAMAKAMIIHYNRQGSSLSMYEQGLIISSLVKEHSISQKEVSKLLRQSQSWVCRRLGMIDRLLPQLQDEIRMGGISVSHGRELVKLPRGKQSQALEVVVRERLTSRECTILVDKLLKCRNTTEDEFLYKNIREVIHQVLYKDKYYDSRLSEHGNRLLKAREILKLEANILGSLLRDVQTERLTEQERGILYPSLAELPCFMSKLSEDINKKLVKNER